MGCNCGGTPGTGKQYQVQKADGTKVGQPYASRTEAIAAMSLEPGSAVVTVN